MVVEGRAVERAQRGHAHQRHGRTRTATPGTRRLERLNENLGAADIHLTADDLAAIDTAPPRSPCWATATPEPCKA